MFGWSASPGAMLPQSVALQYEVNRSKADHGMSRYHPTRSDRLPYSTYAPLPPIPLPPPHASAYIANPG